MSNEVVLIVVCCLFVALAFVTSYLGYLVFKHKRVLLMIADILDKVIDRLDDLERKQ